MALAALEREGAAQHNTRFAAMAGILRAYAPALDGDYVSADDFGEVWLACGIEAATAAAGQSPPSVFARATRARWRGRFRVRAG